MREDPLLSEDGRIMKRYAIPKICGVIAGLILLGVIKVAEADFVIYLRNGKEMTVEEYRESENEIRYKVFGGQLGMRKTRIAVIVDRDTGEKRIFNHFDTIEAFESFRESQDAELRRLEEEEVAKVGYKILEEEDLSYREVVRVQFRIRVTEPLSEGKLRGICDRIIRQQKKLKPHNAISFLFYFPDTDIRGHYTAGKADWGPDGKWEDAGNVKPGDYSRHQLAIDVGNALGEVLESGETALPEDTRKKLFHQIVYAQDSGIKGQRAYELVATQYGLPVSSVEKIVVEGVAKRWPMPR